ncbi:MAG: hypothetical protein DHS20C08_01620 [Rhodomicrobium sp.]|nr:MAG: hypothetical protein DHS20C08_01620 [Rhodomicrobium sp.]
MSEVETYSPLAVTNGYPRHERPIWIWDLVSGRFIWANGEGIKFWSARSLDNLQSLRLSNQHPALLTVRALLPFDESGAAKDVELEFASAGMPRIYTALCRPGQMENSNSVIVELKGLSHEAHAPRRSRLRVPFDEADSQGEADSPVESVDHEHQHEHEEQPAFKALPEETQMPPHCSDPDVKTKPAPASPEVSVRIHGDSAPLTQGLKVVTSSKHGEGATPPLSTDRSSPRNAVQNPSQDLGHEPEDKRSSSADASPHLMRAERPVNPVLSERTEDRLHELARLIRAAGHQRRHTSTDSAPPVNEGNSENTVAVEDEALTHKSLIPKSLPSKSLLSKSSPPLSGQMADKPSSAIADEGRQRDLDSGAAIAGDKLISSSGSEAQQLTRYWENCPIDITALSGVSDADELDEILNACPKPLAVFSFQKIIAANELFLSEFGYGEFKGLSSDGTDWIMPHARLTLREFFEQTEPHPVLLNEIRLRSGRKFDRPVFIRPLTFVRYDRVLGLAGLDDWHGENGSSEDGGGLILDDGSSSPEAPAQQTATQPQKLQRDGSAPPQEPVAIPGDLTQTNQPAATPASGPETLEDLSTIPLLSAISHEVRTPLNVIIGFSEIMAREEFGPLGMPGDKGTSKYADYVKDIQASAQHALSLINDLLDLTKLRAGKWELEPEETNINDIVRQQTRLMRDMAGKQAVRLRTDLEENLPALQLDQRAMRQILLNLLSNSIKFSPEGSLVRVITERFSDEFVALTVADEGRGMSEAEVSQAMQPFQQIAATDLRRGTGLGLPIARALAEANGMQFAIESEAGVGTHAFMLIRI